MGGRFPTEAAEHLMGSEENKTISELKGVISTTPVPTTNTKTTIENILLNTSLEKPTIPINLFDLDEAAIASSKMFYEGKTIKCLVAPYHTLKDIEAMLDYSENTYVFPEDSMGLDKVKQLISIIVSQPREIEYRIITKNQNIIMDMIHTSVKILTECGEIVECHEKTLAANIHTIRHEILENEIHQISKSEMNHSYKYINNIIEVINSKTSSGITTAEQTILKEKIKGVGEELISNSLSDMLSSLTLIP